VLRKLLLRLNRKHNKMDFAVDKLKIRQLFLAMPNEICVSIIFMIFSQGKGNRLLFQTREKDDKIPFHSACLNL